MATTSEADKDEWTTACNDNENVHIPPTVPAPLCLHNILEMDWWIRGEIYYIRQTSVLVEN